MKKIMIATPTSGFKKSELVIADGMVSSEAKAQLDSQARLNWQNNKGWTRDYGRNK